MIAAVIFCVMKTAENKLVFLHATSLQQAADTVEYPHNCGAKTNCKVATCHKTGAKANKWKGGSNGKAKERGQQKCHGTVVAEE